MRFAERCSRLLLACTMLAVGAPAGAGCAPGEQVVFHCVLGGGKLASLCARRTGDAISALRYRYGRADRDELSVEAGVAGSPRFSATVAPLTPRASVRQVWFRRGGSTYLLSQCVGGDCPSQARLTVLRGDRVLSNRRCLRGEDDRAWFAPALASFGGDAASSRSSTPLLEIDDVDLGIERFYPGR